MIEIFDTASGKPRLSRISDRSWPPSVPRKRQKASRSRVKSSFEPKMSARRAWIRAGRAVEEDDGVREDGRLVLPLMYPFPGVLGGTGAMSGPVIFRQRA